MKTEAGLFGFTTTAFPPAGIGLRIVHVPVSKEKAGVFADKVTDPGAVVKSHETISIPALAAVTCGRFTTTIVSVVEVQGEAPAIVQTKV